jgi:uncharacterized protein YndB with AHSA1/START domain
MSSTSADGALTTDRIEKHAVLRAPLSRVWQAITDSQQFGEWFRVDLQGAFAEGAVVSGRMTEPGYEHAIMEVLVEKISPQSYFAFRWHPYEENGGVDFATAPTTLVEFFLEEVSEGTRLTIVESGFDCIPPDKRGEAVRNNDQGWSYQMRNVERYVTGA